MTDQHLSRRTTTIAMLAAALGSPALAFRAAAQDATPPAGRNDTDDTDDTNDSDDRDDDRGGPGGDWPQAEWVAIRTYQLTAEADRDALIAVTEERLEPILWELDGFVAFYILRPDDRTWTAVTVWRDKEASDAGGQRIREWVAENVADSIDGPPQSVEGSVDIAIAPGGGAPGTYSS